MLINIHFIQSLMPTRSEQELSDKTGTGSRSGKKVNDFEFITRMKNSGKFSRFFLNFFFIDFATVIGDFVPIIYYVCILIFDKDNYMGTASTR